ncbi:unnamed protein product [Acanthoscelides obtectus]|uniref:inositol-phosphate phosphatase n=1 Tax=Acanthoscelides obtectus TaxID=200917 RepID=A0A9P0LFK6_ACAOB|nr:unnamed protein product [Acanthoscelides obtectus]CAK1675995.1 Putative inositol monophosphatase 3 [Acanthoscelides obtectus]
MNFGGAIRLNKAGICVLAILFIFLLYNFSKNDTIKEPSKISLNKLLNVAIEAAESGGRMVVATKDNMNLKSKGLTNEGLMDPLTAADLLSHCSMVQTLKHHFPSLRLISEEKAACLDNVGIPSSLKNIVDDQLEQEIADNEVVVWIDPLDATYEYSEKLYQYVTTMVCVAVKGKAVMGVIHSPFNKTTSWVWVDKTMSKDLSANLEVKKKNATKIVVSRSHRGEIESILKKNVNMNKNPYELIIAAGAGYKALQVAKGEADAYLHSTKIKKWDVCAGNAILSGLGGEMTDKYGDQIDYSDSNKVVLDGLVATLRNHDRFLGVF